MVLITTNVTADRLQCVELSPRTNKLKRFMRVFFGRKVVFFGSIIIILFVMVAIFAPFLTPHDPIEQNLRETLQQPSRMHLLGTDQLGRDLLSRIISGSRVSLAVGIVSVAIGGFIGVLLGLISGYFGGIFDTIVMRFVDALLAIPPLVLALAIGAALGGGLVSVMISLGISLIPTYARLLRGQVLSVKETDYIMAAKVVGCSNMQIMLKHILPNCLPPIIVLVTLNLGFAILAEAGLSFLGLGIDPPAASWGAIINDGYKRLMIVPILSFAPGLCIFLLVLAFNLVGDGLRDALDPRLRGTI